MLSKTRYLFELKNKLSVITSRCLYPHSMRATDSRNVSSPRMTMALSQLKNGLSLINGEPPLIMQREFVIQSAISGLKGTTKDKARVGRIFYDKLKARWYVFIIEDDNQFVVVVDRYFIASKYGYEYKLVVREGDEISYKDPIATDSFFTNGMPTYTMNYNILPNMTNITFDDAIEQTENFEASYYRYSTTIVQIDKDSNLCHLRAVN